MSVKSWIWKSVIAGLAGMIVHSLFLYLKTRIGLLPSFPRLRWTRRNAHCTNAISPGDSPGDFALLGVSAGWLCLRGQFAGQGACNTQKAEHP
jgi:hypothetical protein